MKGGKLWGKLPYGIKNIFVKVGSPENISTFGFGLSFAFVPVRWLWDIAPTSIGSICFSTQTSTGLGNWNSQMENNQTTKQPHLPKQNQTNKNQEKHKPPNKQTKPNKHPTQKNLKIKTKKKPSNDPKQPQFPDLVWYVPA